MFRIENGEDISDDEFANIVKPHLEKTDVFLEHYIMPEYIAYYIASGFYYSALWECSFDIQVKSSADLFNYFGYDMERLKNSVKTLLEEKYSLKVIAEEPNLKLEIISLVNS